MSTNTDISNLALSLIGSDATVTSLSPPDGTVEAGLCSRFLPMARRMMLELGAWSFAMQRVELAEVVNTSSIWLFAYALPSDAISVSRVLPQALPASVPAQEGGVFTIGNTGHIPETLFTNRDEANGWPFEVEGAVLRSNAPFALLKYTVDVPDPSNFTPSFVVALSYMLASYLAGPIVKGMPGVELGQTLMKMASSMAERASAADANDSLMVNNTVAASVMARR